ncbi:hypothetical protein [Streptomyces phytophilus]|uniref:hypothetical protein n=1 Tax=Streptomyces phytophilus TaxID=722715 RepID=UPI0015F0693A|nr:hypothetical protein [Streptomyces phytophilus]
MNYLTIISSAIAVSSAVLSFWALRSRNLQLGYDLARSLSTELTSAEISATRSRLSFYRRGLAEFNDDVLNEYFSMLWRIERIRIGRQSLAEQRLVSGTKPVVRFLDDNIRWHIGEWAIHWPELRSRVQADLRLRGNEPLDDHESLRALLRISQEIDDLRHDAVAAMYELGRVVTAEQGASSEAP